MVNKSFCFIKINREKGYVETSGITFKEFYDSIPDKPRNLLLIQGFPREACISDELGLEYIPTGMMDEFSRSDIYDYGDFCWMDFQEREQLGSVSGQELAEFLYFLHRASPLSGAHFESLHNRYAYCAHDDGWYVKLYMQDHDQYRHVIEHKLLLELKGRKKTIPRIPAEIMDEVFKLCLQGVAIDFEHSYLTGVRIYPVGDQEDVDAVHEKLDRMRMRLQGPALEYETNTKKWRLNRR